MRRLAVVLVLGLLASACDQTSLKKKLGANDEYEMREGKDGRTIRLNKTTGEMAVLENGVLVPVKTADEVAKAASERSSLAAPKDWSVIEVPVLSKDLTAYLKTSWRDDLLYYQFWVTATPKLKTLRQRPYGRYFEIKMLDSSGFHILKINVPLGSMTGIVDENDQVTWYSMNDSVACNENSYRDAKDWSLEWNL